MTTQGRRYPDVEDPFEPHERMEAGGYRRVHYSPPLGWQWEIVDPAGQIGRLGKHHVEEHSDGTLTVTESILNPAEGGWHGFLEHGIWREA